MPLPLTPGEIALMIPIIGVSIPVVAIVTSHQRKMAEIKAKIHEKINPQLQNELAALRREVSELRDVSTRYDLSFDAALTRLESRVDRVEQGEPRSVGGAYGQREYTQSQAETNRQTVGR